MQILIIIVFLLAYIVIAFEHSFKINKTAPALLSGALCWTIYILFSSDKDIVSEQLLEDMGAFSGILFFLMGAMTIVEIVDLHGGFNVITELIKQTNKRKLLWIISGIAFFLSPVLDNLTTAIVVVSLLQKLIADPRERLYFVGMIVVAANAGGAWSPIGDVTTTMLWLGGQITAGNIIKVLLIPSIVSVVVPLLIVTPRFSGHIVRPELPSGISAVERRQQLIVLVTGITVLVLVPVFKTLTHLPPYMGILVGLGIMWVVAEKISASKEHEEAYKLSPAYALRKIDSASILFFLGILLSIAALERIGLLHSLAKGMDDVIGNKNAIVLIMGVLSSVIDNVPLMAAAQGMYSLNTFPVDDPLWEFLAYCTGTGGSILIIGSAAGVAVMGIAKVDFFWYLKKISWVALAGYLAGAAAFLIMQII